MAQWQFSCATARARTCFAVPLAARQVDQVQLALLERGVARLAVRVDALNFQNVLQNKVKLKAHKKV